ncbi:hypothetical protein [Glaciibacter flavus]|uniref:hypothetical protein n=1 Tax=Orlajensenia flava TaxID=2565934 RepID=UPI003B00A4A3
MTEQTEPWRAQEAPIATEDRLMALERQLALVDRVIGLEAEVAQLSVVSSLTPTEQLGAEQQLGRLRTSPAWRIGRVATAPLRIARRVARRGTHA